MSVDAAGRKRALLVKFGAIGDVVMVVPAARALAEQGYAIDWVCGGVVAPLLECYTWIRPIVADDRAILKGSPVERVRALAAVWRQLAGVRYEVCATLYYDRRYGVVTLPVRAGRRLKLERGDRVRELLPGRNHMDEFFRILLRLEDSCRDGSMAPVRPDRLPACPLREKTALRRIAMVPGGASNMVRQQTLRRWPVERYAALAQVLLGRGWEVVLLGGPGDEWVNPSFAGMAVTNLVGKLSLPEVIAVCGASDAVVSHDTGPMHLAGLTATPLLGIYGPTDPHMFLPRRDGALAIWGGQGFACRPCYDGTDFAPCRDNGCVQQVSVERVLGELDAVLAGGVRPWRVTVPFPEALGRG